MNLLLDTHALLWFVAGDGRLSRRARQAIEAPGTVNYVSMASWWEMAVKLSLGKLELDDPLDVFLARRVDEGFRILPIQTEHLTPLVALPFHHRDPFDRLLVCQSVVESLPLCSGDENFSRYGIRVLW